MDEDDNAKFKPERVKTKRLTEASRDLDESVYLGPTRNFQETVVVHNLQSAAWCNDLIQNSHEYLKIENYDFFL